MNEILLVFLGFPGWVAAVTMIILTVKIGRKNRQAVRQAAIYPKQLTIYDEIVARVYQHKDAIVSLIEAEKKDPKAWCDAYNDASYSNLDLWAYYSRHKGLLPIEVREALEGFIHFVDGMWFSRPSRKMETEQKRHPVGSDRRFDIYLHASHICDVIGRTVMAPFTEDRLYALGDHINVHPALSL